MRHDMSAGAEREPRRPDTTVARAAEPDALPWRRSPSIPRRPDRTTAPLSFQQRRLWFVEQVQRSASLYNVPLGISLLGPLDETSLHRALLDVVERHEVLRTTFADSETGGEPRQVIAERIEIPWRVIALEGMTGPARARAYRGVIEEEGRGRFDLRTGPLIRAALVRFSPRRHLLLVTVHHLVFDGWSIEILLHELAALYEGHAQGWPKRLPPLPIQYGDYAEWQRTRLTDEMLAADRAYWREALADAPELLELPTDRPRRPGATAGDQVRFTLPVALSARIDAFCRSEGVTPFILFLSLLHVLLGRHARTRDVCVGAPMADRTLGETQTLLGLFVNMLVLRADLSGERTFRQLLALTKTMLGQATAHSRLPFDDLVQLLGRAGRTGHAPLFQTTLNYSPAQRVRARAGAVVMTAATRDTGMAKFDLSVTVQRRGARFVGSLQYATDLFDEATIRQVAARYCRLIAHAIASPDAPVSRLPIESPAERQRVVVEWNATNAEYPAGATLTDLFAGIVAAQPDHPAIVAPEGAITYGALDARAERIAQILARRGIGVGSIVAVWLDRSIDLVAAILGVVKAGAAYLPMHAHSPEDRVAFQLRDANAAALLTHSRRPAGGLPQEVPRIDVDRERDIAPDPTGRVPSRATPHDIAYVIFTSGSTGEPKGVSIRHRSLVNFISWYQRTFAIGPSDRGCQLASPGFDACVWDIWGHLLCGATLCIADESALLLPSRLRDWFVATGVTIGFVPTPLAERLMKEPWPHETALRVMLIGGDRATSYPPATLPFRIVNAYGPAECTIVATAGEIGVDPGDGRLPDIGRPIANTQVYLLDEHDSPVPIGIPGELCIGGVSVGAGYLRRPELTAAAFVRNPFVASGETMYRTGDIARHRPDGTIEYLGRVDTQVKIRGCRIELGEIEAALKRCAGIRDAAATVHDGPHGPVLAAYVVTAGPEEQDTHLLRTELRRRLPDHMVPSGFVVLDRLPLTPSGKLDRRALPELPSSDVALALANVPPRSPLEVRLADVWSSVLGVPHLGVQDNFFDLGGHSLLAMQIVARSEGLFDVDTLFTCPTIEALAHYIETTRSDAAGTLLA